MTTTLAQRTARKYRGKFAAGYRAKRQKQLRWDLENEAVETLLTGMPPGTTVLDVPVGEGRYLPLYDKLRFRATGIDISQDMLLLAEKKRTKAKLYLGDIYSQPYADPHFDATVCVRFLDLVDEHAMRSAMTEICRVTRTVIVLTIRLGDEYVLKSNTATHCTRTWYALVRRLGWRVDNLIPVFKQGWHVMKLTRRDNSTNRREGV